MVEVIRCVVVPCAKNGRGTFTPRADDRSRIFAQPDHDRDQIACRGDIADDGDHTDDRVDHHLQLAACEFEGGPETASSQPWPR